MHERWWLRAAAIAAVPLAAVLAGCQTTPSTAVPPSPTTAAATTTAPKPIPYNLYTHCGIDYARVGNRYYEATPPLSDGSGNPPPGWGNPYQPGTMTVISPTQAVFTDKAGHRVVFTLVPSGGPGRTTAPVCS
jgi:hypothetical protein